MSNSQQGTLHQFDVLVLGSGLAGLYFALKLCKLNPTLKIAILSKSESLESNSLYAQGGIAASSPNKASIQAHIDDTLKAGDGDCIEANVRALIQKGDEVVQELIACQVPFSKSDGKFNKAVEGGHSERRIYHCDDATGRQLVTNLFREISAKKQIQLFENHCAVNLIKAAKTHDVGQYGEVLGAYVFDEPNNRINTFLSKLTVLATGGSGKVYRYTTNPEVATGDGVAMAYRAGARTRHLEFFQFHPTLLHHPTLNNFLISEALRGEGARLKNADSLEAFMHHYAPKDKDLATRDVVARAIFSEIERSQSDFVYLDITHHTSDFLQKRFPTIFKTLASVNIDMSKDLIPVVPAAHYQCGGVMASTCGQTDLKRLFAIGEVAYTGLHGANRLASNSLLEAAVMADFAAEKALPLLNTPAPSFASVAAWFSGEAVNPRRASQINAHWRGLRGEMMSYAGIVRTEAGLKDLLGLIKIRKKIIEDYYWHHQICRDLIELRNIIQVAELICISALKRQESRGGHYREDYPKREKANTFTLNSTRIDNLQTIAD